MGAIHGVARGDLPRLLDLRGSAWRERSAQRVALVVASSFAVAGLAWVLVTDVLLYRICHDRVLIARIETAKGWVFIALAAVLLYVITLRSALRLVRARRLLASVVESIAEGLLFFDRDRRIVHANPAAVRLLRGSLAEL